MNQKLVGGNVMNWSNILGYLGLAAIVVFAFAGLYFVINRLRHTNNLEHVDTYIELAKKAKKGTMYTIDFATPELYKIYKDKLQGVSNVTVTYYAEEKILVLMKV